MTDALIEIVTAYPETGPAAAAIMRSQVAIDDLHQQQLQLIRLRATAKLDQIEAREQHALITLAILRECHARNLDTAEVMPGLYPYCEIVDGELSITIDGVWHSFEDAIATLWPIDRGDDDATS